MTPFAHLRGPTTMQPRSAVARLSNRPGSAGNSRIMTKEMRPRSPSTSTLTSSTSSTPSISSVAARATPNSRPPLPMPAWDGIYNYVTKRNLETISPKEAFDLATKKGWILVDVRPTKRHEQSAPDVGEGNIASLPLYDTPDFSKPSLTRYLRAAVLASQGVAPVELDVDFGSKVLQLLEKENKSGLLMLCEVGGSLTPTTGFPTGKTSRSLQAAFKAMEAGVDEKKVKHVGGGCFGFAQEEEGNLPMTAEYDASGVGRTPGIVSQEQQGQQKRKKW